MQQHNLATKLFALMLMILWSSCFQSSQADEIAPRFLSQTSQREQPDLFQPLVSTNPLPSSNNAQQSFQQKSFQKNETNRTISQSDASSVLKKPNKITPLKKTITPRNHDSAQSTGGIATTLVALTLIVLFILIAARLWQKHGLNISGGLPSEILEPLGKRYLDQKQSIQLVRLGTRILVLGSGPEGMTTLAEITDPLEVDYLSGACRKNSDEQMVAANFNKLFQRAVKPDFTNRANTVNPQNQPRASEAGGTTQNFTDWNPSRVSAGSLTKENDLA